MLNFLLNKQSGDNIPDGIVGNDLQYIAFFIVLIIGIAIGYGIRKLIETYKNAPNCENDEKGDK